MNRNYIVVDVFYRRPGSSIGVLHSLNQFMNERVNEFQNSAAMGNFNSPGITWHSLTSSGHETNIRNELIKINSSLGLSQTVAEEKRLN